MSRAVTDSNKFTTFVLDSPRKNLKSNKRRVGIAAAILAVLLVLGICAGIFWFRGSVVGSSGGEEVYLVDGILTISKGRSMILQRSLSLDEILIDGGELRIDPLVALGTLRLNISKSLRVLNGGRLQIQANFRNASVNVSVSESLSVLNGGQVFVFTNSSSLSNISLAANFMVIESGGNITIDHRGNSIVQLQTQAIGMNSGTLSVSALSRQNEVVLSFNGRTQLGLNTPFSNFQRTHGFNFIAVENGSRVDMQGSSIPSTFVQINQTINIGDEWIVLDQAVSNWRVGDWIAVGATGFFFEEAERFQILEISERRIRISPRAKFMHYGDLQMYDAGWRNFSVNQRAEVALLTRNIRLISNSSIGGPIRGAQIVGTSNSVLKLQFIEIEQGGHETQLRRYPIHFHILGNTPGQLVRGCSVHLSGNRCMTIHSTNNVQIENNVCFDIIGHAFFLENAIETGNRFFRNLGMTVRAGSLLPTDLQPSTFWITNANNTFIENIASGSENTAFWYLGNTAPLNDAFGMQIKPSLAPWGVFDSNIAHTCRMGLRLDEQLDPVSGVFIPGSIDPRRNDTTRMPILVNRTFIHHAYDMGYWIRTSVHGDFICTNCISSDCKLGHRLSFHHQLRDSLIVGNSANSKCSQDFLWGVNGTSTSDVRCIRGRQLGNVIGHAVYDGPNELDRVHFAGFSGTGSLSRSYAFGNVRAFLKSTSYMARKLSFDRDMSRNAIFDLTGTQTCSIWSSQIFDEDGSITGTPNSYIIPEIVNASDNPALYLSRVFVHPSLRSMPHIWDKGFNMPSAGDTASCTRFGNRFAFVCNERAGLILIEAPVLRTVIESTCVNYTRSDGLKMTDCTRDVGFHTSVRLNKPNLSYGFESEKHIPVIHVRLFEVLPGEFIIHEFQNVTARSQIQFRTNNNKMRNIPMYSSMPLLSASNSTGYYLNSALRTAYVKMVAQAYDYNSAISLYRSQYRYNGVVLVQVVIN